MYKIPGYNTAGAIGASSKCFKIISEKLLENTAVSGLVRRWS